MGRDELFKIDNKQPFDFNESVVEVYDDMVGRSIPFYEEVTRLSVELLSRYCPKEAKIVNLGCATGSLEFELLKLQSSESYHIESYDLSPLMLKKAKEKLRALAHRVKFHEADIFNVEYKDVSGIVCNYTLQFTEIRLRENFIKKLYVALKPGGILILSEKVISSSKKIDEEFFYHRFKKRNGYSDDEIINKKKALEGVLRPLSIEENLRLLQSASFKEIVIPFKWYNFATFLAVKDE